MSDNRAVLEAFEDLFAKRDLDGLLPLLDPAVEWTLPGPPRVPYCGTYRGHDGFAEWWRRLWSTVDITDGGHTIMGGPDATTFAVTGWESGRTVRGQTPYSYDWVQEYTFTPDHKIGRMRQYFNPLAILEALGAVELPSIPAPFTLPFYYASLVHLEVLYLVDPDVVYPYLEGTGLVAATFDDRACTGFNYQMYAGAYNSGGDVTQELELNILAYPADQADQVARVGFREFVAGDEQSKLIGNHRVWVPCDNDLAIKAGKELFGEPKFKTAFETDLPVQNAPGLRAWTVTVDDPDHLGDPELGIFTCHADLSGLLPELSTPSPFTEYGVHDGLIGCRWNVLGDYDTYFFEAGEDRVRLTYGSSGNPMRADMQRLIGDTPAAVARTLVSQPVAFQSRAYRP